MFDANKKELGYKIKKYFLSAKDYSKFFVYPLLGRLYHKSKVEPSPKNLFLPNADQLGDFGIVTNN
ncbi:MAG: hypothetical protein LAT76_03080 [Schleiferiaceae bacterium]|nr:hypothetical protein [Schleiferiaceae bacterium]